jgi:hypothetical protein
MKIGEGARALVSANAAHGPCESRFTARSAEGPQLDRGVAIHREGGYCYEHP